MSRRKKRGKRPQHKRHEPATTPRSSMPWWWIAGMIGLAVFVVAMLVVRERRTDPSSVTGAVSSKPDSIQFDPTQTDELVQTSSAISTRLADDRRLDPRRDGWDSEATAEDVKHVLLQVLTAIDGSDSTNVQTNDLDELVSDDFAASPLRPPLETRFETDTIIVSVQAGSVDTVTHPTRLHKALQPLNELMKEATNIHRHVKVIRVDLDENEVRTSSLIEVDGQLSDGTIAFQATWDCEMERRSSKGLQLKSIQASDHREIVSKVGRQRTWLVDATEAVLGKTDAFRQQLAFGLNHWLPRVERVHGIHAFARWGLAVGDVNGDQRDDVYVCQPGGLPNRLFVREADGTATERAHEYGVDFLDHTSSALLIDLDNDGDQDLTLATASGLLVMSNNGSSKFELRKTLTTGDTDFMSLSACDFDQDGDLDLYACIEFPQQSAPSGDTQSSETGASFIYHDANDGAANALFRNDIVPGESWEFVDVADEVGLDVNNRRHSLAAAWEDFDNDGDQDLYVANDYGQNCLYQNEKGMFTEIATSVDVVDSASGMSVSWGDYNHDGWMDLYVANMFSSAGNRITRQPQFKPDEQLATRAAYSRFAKGNSLFSNAEGQFTEVSSEAAVEMGRWAWSSLFADLNNDSWEDLVVANGYITTEDTGDL